MNRVPHLKQFVKAEGHADGYEGLEIKYIPGHLPELLMLNEAGEEDPATKEDLKLLNPEGKMGDAVKDIAGMHAFFAEKGFVRKEGVEIPEAMSPWHEGMKAPPKAEAAAAEKEL